MKELNGKYVVLRPIKTTDLKTFAEMLNEQDINRFTQVPKNYSAAAAKKWMQKTEQLLREGTSYELVIVDKKTKWLVGNIALRVDKSNRSGDLGYLIGKPFRGRGYIYEAAKLMLDMGFRHLHLNRIEISCATENKKSAMVINNLGAKFEGILRQNLVRGGKVQDKAVFSILKKEWSESKKKIEAKIKDKFTSKESLQEDTD